MKIKRILNENTYIDTKEVDPIVPVCLSFYESNSVVSEELDLHYEYVNRASNVPGMIELSINRKNKKLMYITLVTATAIRRTLTKEWPYEKKGVKRIIGNVEFGCDRYEGTLVHEEKDMEIYFNQKDIYVEFSSDTTQEIIMDDLKILINSNKEITGFIFSGFTSNESKIIDTAFSNGYV